MVFWAKSLIIMYGIRFGGGRVEILTFIIVNGVITPPYSLQCKSNMKRNMHVGVPVGQS